MQNLMSITSIFTCLRLLGMTPDGEIPSIELKDYGISICCHYSQYFSFRVPFRGQIDRFENY